MTEKKKIKAKKNKKQQFIFRDVLVGDIVVDEDSNNRSFADVANYINKHFKCDYILIKDFNPSPDTPSIVLKNAHGYQENVQSTIAITFKDNIKLGHKGYKAFAYKDLLKNPRKLFMNIKCVVGGDNYLNPFIIHAVNVSEDNYIEPARMMRGTRVPSVQPVHMNITKHAYIDGNIFVDHYLNISQENYTFMVWYPKTQKTETYTQNMNTLKPVIYGPKCHWETDALMIQPGKEYETYFIAENGVVPFSTKGKKRLREVFYEKGMMVYKWPKNGQVCMDVDHVEHPTIILGNSYAVPSSIRDVNEGFFGCQEVNIAKTVITYK